MVEAVAFSCGLLTSVVLAGAERNRRENKAHSRVLTSVGYILCGALGAAAAGLSGYAVFGIAGLV